MDIFEMPVPEKWISIKSDIIMDVFCKTKYNYFYRPYNEPQLEMQLARHQFEKEFMPLSKIPKVVMESAKNMNKRQKTGVEGYHERKKMGL